MTAAPTAEQLDETIRHALSVLPQLVDDARWIHGAPDGPRTRHAQPEQAQPRDPDPDVVPGARWDLGDGRDTNRRAYAAAAAGVASAHHHAGVALAHYTGRRPPLTGHRPVRPHELAAVANDTARRLRQLRGTWDVTHGPDDARRAAWAAANRLIAAHAALRALMADTGGTPDPPAERRCLDCDKPVEDPTRRRCWRCAAASSRARRTGRPARRPPRRWADATQAKERRQARGEDYGDAPLPAGSYCRPGPDGVPVWVPATVHPGRRPARDVS